MLEPGYASNGDAGPMGPIGMNELQMTNFTKHDSSPTCFEMETAMIQMTYHTQLWQNLPCVNPTKVIDNVILGPSTSIRTNHAYAGIKQQAGSRPS